MLAFGLGTAVALLALGLGASFAGLRLGRWSARLAPAFVVLFGAVLLWRGFTAGPVCHG
jgi:sulfite exporter TauE/SafE